MKGLIFLLLGTLFSVQLVAQSTHFSVDLEPMQITELGGLQSYAIGSSNGEWLIVGGRLDGLHRRQPFASFSPDGNNQDIIVVNPSSKKIWRTSLAQLSPSLKEQLSSSNIQFYQDGERLLLTGGYGYSPTKDDHVTFPYLTIIDVPNLIQSIKKNQISDRDFIQIEHPDFQVTGGRLGKIKDVYFLVGGHKFMGRYNPMGPEHGPGFEQVYTNEIRKFKVDYTKEVKVEFLAAIHDERHLHRRDYNLVPFIKDKSAGLMAYSGVFQPNADYPWLYPVHITNETFKPLENILQYFNHYHCASLPIYDKEREEMHTFFFGGIAQFLLEDNVLVQDNDIPFVNTITDLSFSQNDGFQERVLEKKMPGFLGAGSEFIFHDNAPKYSEGVLSGDEITSNRIHVGYIFGGIRSSKANIFWINEGEESIASSVIYKVYIQKATAENINLQNAPIERVFIYPIPELETVRLVVEMENSAAVELTIRNEKGVVVHKEKIAEEDVKVGKNIFNLKEVGIGFGEFQYELNIGGKRIVRKVRWAE
ncbi:MAG: T9SS C-terminal target domain-containing protein [Saprospiraceae bacterium]|nr:T9SS C-terminal target domain-containing protein [Saprospiraceae bacterium]